MFDPKVGKCLSCQQPLSETEFYPEAYATIVADLREQMGSWKKARPVIIKQLGVSEAQADEAIEFGRRVSRNNVRDEAGKIAASGGALMAFAILYGLAFPGIVVGRIPNISVAAFGAGLVMIFAGIIKSFAPIR